MGLLSCEGAGRNMAAPNQSLVTLGAPLPNCDGNWTSKLIQPLGERSLDPAEVLSEGAGA